MNPRLLCREGVCVLLGLLSIGLSVPYSCSADVDTRAPALDSLPVVPRPVEGRWVEGKAFPLSAATRIVCDGEANEAGARAVESLERLTNLRLTVTADDRGSNRIVLRLDGGLFPDLPGWQRAEGYRLSVSAKRIELSAAKAHGLANGVQTLVQLVAPDTAAAWQVRPCEVRDYPRFQWRGLLLDPARHFFPPDDLKKFIEVMAFYKYNRLHLHLTDGAGWRLEIKKYPRLAEVGSVRKESPKRGDRDHGDGRIYGPFYYTQEQVRDLVAFARARQVTLVPEIEMPGHFGAAAAAYPEFTCRGGPFEVETRWIIGSDILCAGNDAAIAFAKDVVGEVCDLFPSEFIHIGGDEAPRDRWKSCPKCQARMKAEGFTREAQLQTWINHQLEKELASRGRRLIGWDEILEGGLTPGAVVMSWRGAQGGIDAATAGHDVVMSPSTYCYFDYAQAEGPNEPEHIGWGSPTTLLSTVYGFEPVPAAIPAGQRGHILGAQGNIWGEFVHDLRGAEYFGYPRALALAEVSWSPPPRRNFEDFVTRLTAQYPCLDRMHVNYRKPDSETIRREVFPPGAR
jgi:hexosaminidase